MTFHPLSIQVNQEVFKTVSLAEINLQDSRLFHVGNYTNLNQEVFFVEQVSEGPYNSRRDVPLQIRYTLNLNKRVIERQVYTLLEFLGDMGGFLEGTTFLGYTILLFTQF